MMPVSDVELSIPDVIVIAPKRFPDSRGFFTEIYNSRVMANRGISDVFVQDNLSLSEKAGTIRGLHFQKPPRSQSKLVWVSRGRVLDVAVDLRPTSATYRQHVSVELSAENGLQLYIPHGFAHGFCTLEAGTEVLYKVSDFYSPEAEGGILWSDPDLKIAWPVAAQSVICSDKDAKLPFLKDLSVIF